MKILKEGKQEILHKKFTFQCQNCDCIFEAEEGEWKSSYDWYEDKSWVGAYCPCCNHYTSNVIHYILSK